MTRLRISLMVVAVANFACTGALAAHRKGPPPEQTQFSAEDKGVQAPVRIPDDAWAILKNDSNTKIYLDDKDPSKAAEIQRSWFSAAAVHLRDGGSGDLVVAAEGPLKGADSVMRRYWIFTNTPQGMKMVMTASAHGLVVSQSRFKGVRTIELQSQTCCEVTTSWWRYQDGEFRQYWQTSKEIK